VLLPGIRLDDDVVVGAGAVVTADVAAGTHVRGVPARPVGAAVGAVM
jgi:acetyltransferase-like isoleucine patch superfamily enzyme